MQIRKGLPLPSHLGKNDQTIHVPQPPPPPPPYPPPPSLHMSVCSLYIKGRDRQTGVTILRAGTVTVG
jgi:hypothetical protein